ncbi:MAG TPA: TolC family protein, partial [Flavitalea sp.]|nr:TolC family protein [Flavitalea sp.]
AQVNPELKSLIQQSFTYFPKFSELKQAAAINQQQVELAATGKRPEISGVATYNYAAPVAEAQFPMGNEFKTLQFQPNNNYNLGVNIYQPLVDFGKTKLQVERARHALQESRENIEFNKTQMAAQVATTYYTIVYLHQAIQIQDSVIAVLQSNKSLVESKYRNGDALKVDILTIQNNIDIEQNRKTDLINALKKQLNLLNFTTGSNNDVAKVAFDFPSMPATADESIKIAETQNPDFRIARERIQAAETDVLLSKVSQKPTVGLNGGTGIRNGYQPDINEIRFNYGIGVGMNVPIFSGGRLRQQTRIAESTVKSNELAASTLSHQYKKDLDLAFTDRQTNIERLRNVEEQIAIAKEALALEQSRFRNGVTTNVELLNANTNLQRIELAKIQYQYQLTTAEVEIARLTGTIYW